MFAVFAGVAVVCASTTAMALAGSHMSVGESAQGSCQTLPAPPSASPSPSPGGLNSTGSGSQPGGTPNSSPPSPTQICVSVGVVSSSVHPGSEAQYAITVYPQGGPAGDVTVQISLPAGQTTPGLPAPVFNICGSGDRTSVCTLGTMHVGQTTQLEAEDAVPSNAKTGGTVTLAATVTAAAPNATSTGSVIGSASVSVKPTSSGGGHNGGGHNGGSGSHHHSGGSGSNSGGSSGSNNGGTTGNTQPFTNLPPLLGTGTGTGTTSGGDSSNLFPTINSSTGTSSGNGSHGSKNTHKPYKATTVADILPLNTGQISGQLAGLIVLGLGVLLVFARITLRKPRSSDAKE